eukprot:NODE_831_length_3850_cov_0.209544.p4 type:complete len:103 gc:universal NODE_831_length_3850_cov_0.209544:2229-1921(-)
MRQLLPEVEIGFIIASHMILLLALRKLSFDPIYLTFFIKLKKNTTLFYLQLQGQNGYLKFYRVFHTHSIRCCTENSLPQAGIPSFIVLNLLFSKILTDLTSI